jgi:hypothetical protein
LAIGYPHPCEKEDVWKDNEDSKPSKFQSIIENNTTATTTKKKLKSSTVCSWNEHTAQRSGED